MLNVWMVAVPWSPLLGHTGNAHNKHYELPFNVNHSENISIYQNNNKSVATKWNWQLFHRPNACLTNIDKRKHC